MSTERDVLIYLTTWCGTCHRTLRFLDEHDIPYRTINIDEDPEAARTVMTLNRGNRSVPTILIDGEHALTEPTAKELAATFGV